MKTCLPGDKTGSQTWIAPVLRSFALSRDVFVETSLQKGSKRVSPLILSFIV